MPSHHLMNVADGVMDTANGGWITCTPENILMYDMFHRSGFLLEEVFLTAIQAAYDAGYIPKMWIPNKENDGATSASEEGSQ